MERGAYGHRYANCRAPATTRSARLPPCRHFLNGSCPFGQNCRHSHELPAWKSSQVCRYFQRGGCWFGDRCRYEHVLQTDGSFLDSRRRSAPVIHPVLSGEAAETRRGSEPSIQQVHGTYAGSRRVSEPAVASLQRNFERLSTEYEEPTVAEFVPRIQQPKLEILSARSTLQVQNGTSQCHTRAKSTSAHVPYNPVGNITEENEDLNGLHASKQGENVDTAGSQCRTQNVGVTAAEAYERSKDVTCGICMDKVYEKPAPDDRCFGILPNCNHAFCLSCIVTWRKTKDFQAEVIKSCPQCRVKSTYYIPYKYWVSDPVQKQNLISNFKERSGKIKCKFFTRHGCCPFKSECIYLHEMPQGHRRRRRRRSATQARRLSSDDSDSEGFNILQYAIALALLHEVDDDLLEDYFHRRYFQLFLDDDFDSD
ncbi:makorin, ring finger protein, 4 isoform X1 [Polypterus senegalus]|uniref:makorin, ring finger protein, 4 isoform X1 n=1 Tax=Polypterus senegalus TaxID=55291 RepID=UPI001963AE3A|nr:makorin, ring finger protein, 4 isoform X1 [Polypterus senegalus]